MSGTETANETRPTSDRRSGTAIGALVPDLNRRIKETDLPLNRNIAVLTGGGDRPYALGLASALIEEEIGFDFIGSDDLDSPILHNNPLVVFRNLRGDQAEDASKVEKINRVLRYYKRLIAYAMHASPKVFHILWNNKIEWFDRTLLMLFYRICGRRIVLTAHNVNAASRDDKDSALNRLTLRLQYRLAHHIFVHTQQMRQALQKEFHVPPEKASVIPFGINSSVPDTSLDRSGARAALGLKADEKALLFFGNVAPYKGLEYLVEAMAHLTSTETVCRLLVAGRLKCPESYWQKIQESIARLGLDSRILLRIEYIPDEETEIYFKAADALVLPYTYIFQSGVLFLGYNFGLPVIASDVGSLKEDIVEGRTGWVCPPEDSESLALTIRRYFESELYSNLDTRRQDIRGFAAKRYSWNRVAQITTTVYERLLN